MTLEDRIEAFANLGKYLHAIDEVEFNDLIDQARNENAWFTRESVALAMSGVKQYLDKDHLQQWTSSYNLPTVRPKNVAVVMAGNIPLVGFHDFLTVLISGHHLMAKLSSKDSVLLKILGEKLIEVEPRFAAAIQFPDRLKNFDAVIATGSDNAARYFHYYFGKYPHIIRKNRTSCAVLSGFESPAELGKLGSDVFSYFGLGCRNVSKIFVPREFDFTFLIESWRSFENVLHHHKYHNNYDYQKSILLINKIPFYDSEFVLLRESDRMVSPISVVYYQYYDDLESLHQMVLADKEKIQCVVGSMKPATVPFGQAQSPKVWDYADQVDTLKFLEGLN